MPECENPIEERVGVDTGLTDLHLKGAFLGELWTVSRNWSPWGRPVPLGSARPQVSEHQKVKDVVNTVSAFPSDGHRGSCFFTKYP